MALGDERTYPVVVIGVDPGVTTGLSVFLFTEERVELLEYHQLPDPDFVWIEILRFIRYWQAGYRVVLVVEQFDKRPGVVNPDFTPKFINRDIENNIANVEIVWQIPAAAKNLVRPPGRTNRGLDHLKKFGWYHKAQGHSNDATRHVIVYGVEKLKHRPLIQLGWPKPKEDIE